jgi:hypothetical protein
MIWESSYWKDHLLEFTEKIKNVYLQTPYSEELAVAFEKDIMIAFYSIRKLEEAGKLSSNTKGFQLYVKSYKNIKNVTRLNWHRIDELFELEKPVEEKLGADKLYNQIIHSYIFLISTDETTEVIDGFFFCSDRMRNEKLYYIDLVEIDKFITIVGNDYPSSGSFEFDETIQDYRFYSTK